MKLSIKKAYVARFNDTSVYDYSLRLIIDENTTEHCNCIINAEKGEAIDIDKKCVYHILERNNNGMITLKEAENIVLGTPYVLDVQDIKWEQMGTIEKEILCLKAIPLIIDYRRKEKIAAKVKMLTKKR